MSPAFEYKQFIYLSPYAGALEHIRIVPIPQRVRRTHSITMFRTRNLRLDTNTSRHQAARFNKSRKVKPDDQGHPAHRDPENHGSQ